MNTKQRILEIFGWGFVLWLIGYILGIALFFVVPPAVLGWVIMPIGVAVTLLVLWKKIDRDSLKCYAMVGLIWTILAVVLDYIFLVKLLNPADGYYKLDVYLYYVLTFALPIIVGWFKLRSGRKVARKAR